METNLPDSEEYYDALRWRAKDGDPSALREWLPLVRQKAEEGDPYAQSDLGHAYLFGEGVEKDREKAVFWFQKAADNPRNFSDYPEEVLESLVDWSDDE